MVAVVVVVVDEWENRHQTWSLVASENMSRSTTTLSFWVKLELLVEQWRWWHWGRLVE
jgi:hypothetical protein